MCPCARRTYIPSLLSVRVIHAPIDMKGRGSSMLSLRGIIKTGLLLPVLLLHQTHGFLSPVLPTHGRVPQAASSTRSATTMKYAPQNVQEVWDNHFAAFGGKDVDKILLDYDEDSVITTFNQTDDKKEVFEGIEGARKLFEGFFGALVDQSDLAATMTEVSEDSKMVFLVWRNPASGILDATDTYLLNDDTKKIYRQTVAYKTA